MDDTSFENEEYLFGLVTLAEQDIIVKQTETLKLWNHINQEVLWFVLKESDTFNNLTVG